LSANPEPAPDDGELLRDVARGEESAFAALVRRHAGPLARFVRLFVAPESTEDVLQETWLAVLGGIDRFEGRASFRTWLYQIAANRARTYAARERRREEIERMARAETEESDPVVDTGRFLPDTDPQYPRHWAAPPLDWGDHPEVRLLSLEVARLVQSEIDRLPPVQAAVVTLRDVEGLDAREVGDLIGVSDGHQRVLLHRARTKLWRALEAYFGETA
jgi:RNA polymerase sigma-70 factor (ECF subfamily)